MPTLESIIVTDETVNNVTSSLTNLTERETRRLENTLHKQYFRSIKGYYVNETHNYSLSEELAHEALYKVLKGLPTFQEGRNMANWVHGVARNNLYDYYRSLKTNKNTVNRNTCYVESYTDNTVYTDSNESDQVFLMDRLNKILETFTAVDTLIFRQTVFDGISYQDISEQTSLPIETIKNKLAYMRKKIRTLLINE